MRNVLKYVTIGAVALVSAVGIHAVYQQRVGNFHEVIAGELYRSAQPSGADVVRYHQSYGIRTILNLRDEARAAWYEEERDAAASLGIRVVDHPISSSRGVTVEEARELARKMRDAQKPLLIHCEHGSNRTSLASAIYVDTVANRSDIAALLQLSPYYGHIPVPGIGRWALFASFRRFQESGDQQISENR